MSENHNVSHDQSSVKLDEGDSYRNGAESNRGFNRVVVLDKAMLGGINNEVLEE